MSTIFPFIDAADIMIQTKPIYRDIKTDKEGKPIIKDGKLIFCEGREAIKSWCYFALLTERKKHRCLDRGYGNDVVKLVGKAFLPEVTESEAKRYIKECLLKNRYIQSVENINVEFDGVTLSVSFKAKTDYGEVDINV